MRGIRESRLQAGHQLPGVNVEGSGLVADVEQRDGAFSTFDRADVSPVQGGPFGQGLKRPLPALTVSPDAPVKCGLGGGYNHRRGLAAFGRCALRKG